MRTVRIGERSVTAVGCGDLSLAIAAARGVDRRDVERALTVALELGLTLVDIHPAEDDAERLAGDVIRTLRMRDRVIAVTTVPALGGRDNLIERLPPLYLQARVESALRTTKLDALPLVQLPLRPSWLESRAWPELAGTADRLVREGKVLAWGARLADEDLLFALADPDADPEAPVVERISDELARLIAVPWLASLSVTYNMCARAAEPLIDAANEPVPLGPLPPAPAPASSMIVSAFDLTAPPVTAPKLVRTEPLAILARQPLAGGALAGTLGPGGRLTPRDDRHAIDDATLERIALEVARLTPLVRVRPPAATSSVAARALLERTKRPEHVAVVTLAELALRYVIDRGVIALPRLHRHTLVPDALIAMISDPLPKAAIAWILDDKS